MFCTKCGSQVKDGAMFCGHCGNKIVSRAAAENAQPVQQTAQPVQQTTQQPVQQTAQQPVQQTAQQPVQQTTQQPVQQPVQQPAYSQPEQSVYQQPSYSQPVQNAQQPQNMQQPQAAQSQNMQFQAAQVPNMQQPQAAQYQNTVAQPQNTAAAQTQQPAKKKSKLGLILGLSIGIPVLVIAGLVVLGVNLWKNVFNNDKNNSNNVVVDENDDDDDEKPDSKEDPEPDPEPVATADLSKRTVMIYMVGSTLECPEEYGVEGGAATSDIYEMLDANIPDDTNVVLECGGAYEWVYPSIPDGEVTRFTIENNELVLQEKLGATTMTQTGDLADFITYASTNYPAENYVLLLWDHGGSVPISFGMDQLGDEYDLMTDAEMMDELETAGVHFESVVFDACNMCSLEIGMALKDYSDYMVGAESYVNGIGIYYTNWLEQIGSDDSKYTEQIVEDYMDSLDSYDLVGSMSVIRLDRIQEVYEAYLAYIESVDYEVTYNGDYANYYKARGGCGVYTGTDSVDLITLANKYETDKSTNLINCVENSVVYTESDIAYGHGLTAYSPSSEYYDLYTDGRASLVSLGYDDEILGFYDRYVSQMLANLGSDYVDYYGGDWYVDNYEVADAGSSDETGYLELTELDYYYGCALTDDSWEIIDTIETWIAIEDDDTILLLGCDYQYSVDSEGYIALVDPEYWIFLNDYVASYYCVDYYSDDETGEWSQTGVIQATVNGNEAYLYVYFDQDNPYGAIQGYYLADFETGDIDETVYMIEDDDVIDLVYAGMDADGNEVYVNNEEPIYGSDLEIGLYDIYDSLSEYTTIGYITITDVYGYEYETDMVYLGAYDSVQ